MKPYQFTKFTIAGLALSLGLTAPGFAGEHADTIKGTWVSTSPIETTSDGVKMVVATSTRTYAGATGNGEYSLELISDQIPARIAKYKIEDRFAYKIKGDTLTERVAGAVVRPTSPETAAVHMAARLENILSQPNSLVLTIETLDDTDMVLYDAATKIRYTFKRK